MKGQKEFLRTDREIVNAFIKLMKHKSFEKITVQDIIDEALISRSCFYQHFCDKYEIAEKLQQEIICRRSNSLQLIFSGYRSADVEKMSNKLYEEYRDILEILLKIHTETVDLNGKMCEEYKNEYANLYGGSELERYLYSGIFERLLHYTIDKKLNATINPKEFADALKNVTDNIINMPKRKQ